MSRIPQHRTQNGCNRRQLLTAALSATALPWLPGARADSKALRALEVAIHEQFAEQEIVAGRVSLSLPPLAENGNSVALAVDVDSPQSQSDYVESIHVFAPDNPLPTVLSTRLSPLSGRAQFATRIRLADSQSVVAIARMSDGSLWSGSAKIVVTLAACTDFLF